MVQCDTLKLSQRVTKLQIFSRSIWIWTMGRYKANKNAALFYDEELKASSSWKLKKGHTLYGTEHTHSIGFRVFGYKYCSKNDVDLLVTSNNL